MNTRGRVAIGRACTCGHIYLRAPNIPDQPASVRHAIARSTVRRWLGHRGRQPGIAIFQAITENA